MFSELSLEDFRSLVKELYSYRNARVVVIFLESNHQINLFTAVLQEDLKGHFIFVGGDELTGTTCIIPFPDSKRSIFRDVMLVTYCTFVE